MFKHDAPNRVYEKDLPGGATITFAYDGVGNMSSLQDPSGTITYEYTATNKLHYVTEPGMTQKISFDYKPNDVRTGIHYPTSPTAIDITTTPDNAGRTTQIQAKRSATTLYDTSWSYLAGSTDRMVVKSMTDNTSSTTTSYDYDEVDRLIHETVGSAQTQYAYDGNEEWRLHRDFPGQLPLNHLWGSQFRSKGVKRGDILYPLTVIKGEVFVAGRLEVDQVLNLQGAKKYLDRETLPEGGEAAPEHIVSKEMPKLIFNRAPVPAEILKELRFRSADHPYPGSKLRHVYPGERARTGRFAELLRRRSPSSSAGRGRGGRYGRADRECETWRRRWLRGR